MPPSGRVAGYPRYAVITSIAASSAYERRTDDADAVWEAVENQPGEAGRDEGVPGERWSGRFGSPDDGAQIPLRLPRLHALFASPAYGGRRPRVR
jgi:hypothetical protein